MEMFDKLKNKIKEYYLREDVLKNFQEFSQYREVVHVIKAKSYAPRPGILMYDTDFKLAISEGATSFHVSVERWSNVMLLKECGEDRKKIDEIRSGWDIIIDIDSKRSIEEAKTAAKTIIEFLEDMFSLKPIYIKFSGSRGFHIGINGDSLPEEIDGIKTSLLYPELLHKISIYIKENIKEKLSNIYGVRNPWEYVEIEDNWSYRHLFRMPYSLNEKTWLASIVIDPKYIDEFRVDDAKIDNIKKILPYLDKKSKGDLDLLCYEAIEYYENSEFKKEYNKMLMKKIEVKRYGEEEPLEEIEKVKKEFIKYGGNITMKIEEEFFPNTIKRILAGLQDGRKRGIFILLNFLRKMNWNWDEIEHKIEEWNNKNAEPLRESYVKAQINYFKRNEQKIKNIPPPNFETSGYYDDMGVLDREDLKLGVKNPVSYAYKKKLMSFKKTRKVKDHENNNNRHTRNRKNISK